jgi:hypothetical protein
MSAVPPLALLLVLASYASVVEGTMFTAALALGVTMQALRSWHKREKIKATRTRAGRMLWDVAGYLGNESKRT